MTDDTSRDLRNETNDAPDAEQAQGAPEAMGVESRLSRLADYEVEDGFPDIRGWPVRGSNGRELGIVGDLLVDTALLEVAALDVHLGVGAAGVRGNVMGSARVPIESVQLRPDQYVVVDVEVIPCDDVLMDAGNGTGAVRRVPCGQIGIRRRDVADRAVASAPLEREIARSAVEGDAAPTAASADLTRGAPGDAGEELRER